MAEKGTNGFEDLECYQLAKQVFREAYRLVSLLPPEEKYNLADQMRRAATSILLNIAEGYGRYHYLDCLRFYYIARGSMDEVLSAFITVMSCITQTVKLPNNENSAIAPCAP